MRYRTRNSHGVRCGFVAVAVLSVLAVPARVRAQFGNVADSFEDRETVERNTDEILSSPEFGHFRRISERSPFGGPSGSRGNNDGAAGGDGNEGGDAGGRGRGNGGNRNNRGWRNDGRNWDPDGNRRGGRRPRRGNERFNRSSAPRSSFGSFGGGASAFFQGLGLLVLVVMAGLVAYMVAKAITDRERSVATEIQPGGTFQTGEIEPEHPPGELPGDVYADRARQLAREGKYREAVAQLMLGAMSFVERSGLIRFRKGLTQRDYLRAVGRRKPSGECYKQMLRIYEPLGFGRRAAQRQHFEASLESYTAGFHGREPVSED